MGVGVEKRFLQHVGGVDPAGELAVEAQRDHSPKSRLKPPEKLRPGGRVGHDWRDVAVNRAARGHERARTR